MKRTRENLLARLGAGKHEVGAPEEAAEGRAGVWRGGAPDGAEGAVGDVGLRRERGRELPEVGVEVARGGGGGEEGADGIGCGDGEARRGGGRRHGCSRDVKVSDGGYYSCHICYAICRPIHSKIWIVLIFTE